MLSVVILSAVAYFIPKQIVGRSNTVDAEFVTDPAHETNPPNLKRTSQRYLTAPGLLPRAIRFPTREYVTRNLSIDALSRLSTARVVRIHSGICDGSSLLFVWRMRLFLMLSWRF